MVNLEEADLLEATILKLLESRVYDTDTIIAQIIKDPEAEVKYPHLNSVDIRRKLYSLLTDKKIGLNGPIWRKR